VIYEGPGTGHTHAKLSNLSYAYRVCAIDKAGNKSSGAIGKATPSASESDPPWAFISVNQGAEWTKSPVVTLSLTAYDASPPVQMCISNTNSCTAWTTFAAKKTWTLTPVNGEKKVNAWFRDTWGNRTPELTPYSATIFLDTIAPTNVALTVYPGPGHNELGWTTGSDGAGSGIIGYRAVFNKGSIAPSSCRTGTPVPGYDGTSLSLAHYPLVNGTTYAYRVCAIDAAGNMSSGATKTGTPRP
jgi:hypothetical protein